MPNPVTLGTLITRVRQRCGMEGASAAITDWEITDHLNVALATELYDVIRVAVGDNYYRKAYVIQMQQGVQSYDLPADHLSTISVDVWTSTQGGIVSAGAPGATTLKINARRYMEYERNYYQQILLGWSAGATALYSLSGNQISFQPTPVQAFQVQLNYVPVSPQIGGGLNPSASPAAPNNYTDTWDDVNGWGEAAVLDAAEKVCLKLNRLDMVAAMQARRAQFKTEMRALISLRHAGEPERTQMPWSPQWGDGYRE